MDQGLAGNTNQRRYGATDRVPGVAFAGGLPRVIAGGGLAGDSNNSQFSPTELYNLSENITSNIYTINKGRSRVEKDIRSIGTIKDTQGLRDQIHVTHVTCNELVTQTTNELSRLTEVVRRGNKEQKLQAERLHQEFSETVKSYCKAQKEISEKMKLYLPITGAGGPEEELPGNDTDRLLAMERQQQNQKLIQRELEFESGLMEERAQRIQAIENDVIDVNTIMRNLSEIVHSQGETLDTIENNIENVHGNVELGRQELQKSEGYVIKRRKKLLCLLITAVVIAFILGIVIYISVKR